VGSTLEWAELAMDTLAPVRSTILYSWPNRSAVIVSSNLQVTERAVFAASGGSERRW